MGFAGPQKPEIQTAMNRERDPLSEHDAFVGFAKILAKWRENNLPYPEPGKIYREDVLGELYMGQQRSASTTFYMQQTSRGKGRRG